ncbi:MAG: 16S rRNA (cytidine(1402)-2'-O)-methyltransferase [Acidimicrobiales bacterium]
MTAAKQKPATPPSVAPAGDGELVVIATPIGNVEDLSPRAAARIQEADVVCCEDTRHTGQMLARLGLRATRLLSVHAHNERARVPEVLELLDKGAQVALVSDAGTPTISDPGEALISAAIASGHKVTAVPGPSAALTALVVAGLGTARWRFEGFLPRRGPARATRLGEIAAASHPSVVYEAPQRVASTLADLAQACGGERKVAVCRELTKLFEETWHGTLTEAREHSATTPARGEYVLVVAGASFDGQPHASAAEVRGAVQSRMAAGASRRQAANEVAGDLGVSKRFAYETSLAHGDR